MAIVRRETRTAGGGSPAQQRRRFVDCHSPLSPNCRCLLLRAAAARRAPTFELKVF
jgi:hypothetical protein